MAWIIKRGAQAATLVGLVLLQGGCVTGVLSRNGGFDQRALTVQTVALFDQRQPSRLAKKAWKGDWIFRRDRLELIDLELRNTKPDLLVLQQMMARSGSTAESDRRILSAGSLADYEWRTQEVERYSDTQEHKSMAIALDVPFRFTAAAPEHRNIWQLGTSGYMLAATFAYEGQKVAAFNVDMPKDEGIGRYEWYDFIKERVREWIRQEHVCSKRIIIAGYMPGDAGTLSLSALVRDLGLKDTSSGFCQIDSKCYTATPTNDIFLATVGDESPARTDRIYVSQGAVVYASARNFAEVSPKNRYVSEFGLSHLWPTQRFGWVSQLRLPRCTQAELAAFDAPPSLAPAAAE